MGILKVLGKVVETIAFSPIPEYVGLIGSILKVASVVDAGQVMPSTTKIVWEDNIPSVDECKNTTPGDVLKHLHPVYGDISFKKAGEKYKELDFEGKCAVVEACVSSICGAFYVFNGIARLVYATKYFGESASAKAELNFMKGTVKDISNNVKAVGNGILEATNGRFTDVNMYQNYKNYMDISSALDDMLNLVNNGIR